MLSHMEARGKRKRDGGRDLMKIEMRSVEEKDVDGREGGSAGSHIGQITFYGMLGCFISMDAYQYTQQ